MPKCDKVTHIFKKRDLRKLRQSIRQPLIGGQTDPVLTAQEAQAVRMLIENTITEGRAKHIREIASPELAAEFEEKGFTILGLADDTPTTEEDLRQLLETLKEIKAN